MDPLRSVLGGFLRGSRDSIVGASHVCHYDSEEPARQRRGSSPSQETNLARRRAAQQAERRQQRQAEQKDEAKVKHRVIQCCVLNGAVFGLSMVLFEYIVLPVLRWALGMVLAESGAGSVWPYVHSVLTSVFNMLWVLPVFLLSRIINTIWFQDIADSAYRQRQGRPQLIDNFSKLIADVLISIFIQILFLIQSNLVSLVPLVGVGNLLWLVHLSMLNALYAFEYRWFNMGWQLDRRLSFVEENWPYFLGFGFPLAFLTMISSNIYFSGCVFALLFPMFIISANEAEPVLNNSGYHLRLFSLVVALSDKFIQLVVRRHSAPPPHTPIKAQHMSPRPHTPTSSHRTPQSRR